MLSIKRALKPIVWIGSSFDDLRSFPEDIRKTAGFQLHRLQAGLEAADWKPMPEIGRGVEEVRLRYESGAYRIIYIARYANAVYVPHCFNKKTKRTSEHDKHIAKVRYRTALQEDRNQK